MITFSVVIPVYGVEKYLNQMLQSIREQDYLNAEYILVDDGSPDGCPAMLDAFAREDERYKVIHQINRGVSVARNTGLSNATGDYLYIADSDDWLEKGFLSRMAETIERTHADLICGDWVRESTSGSIPVMSFPEEFYTENRQTIEVLQNASNYNNIRMRISRAEFSYINHFGGAPWRYVVRRQIVSDNHLEFDPYVRGMADDILFALHLYEYIQSVAYVHTTMYHYRIVEESLTRGFKADLLDRYQLIFTRMEEFLKAYYKDEKAYEAYYIRVLLYLSASMGRYFKNPANPKLSKDRYKEFKELLTTEPYCSAIQKAPIHEFASAKTRIGFYILRHGLTRVYWWWK